MSTSSSVNAFAHNASEESSFTSTTNAMEMTSQETAKDTTSLSALPTDEEERESIDDEEAEASLVAKPPVQKRSSFILQLHVPKPTVPPPPPPPVDLSALRCASRDQQSKSSATVEFKGGRTVLDFKCKLKTGTLKIMKSTTIQLDLEGESEKKTVYGRLERRRSSL